MGYTTEFQGRFELDKKLTEAHEAYLKAFARTRRMKRHAVQTSKMPDPKRLAVKLPVGVEGGYFVGAEADSGADFGQAHTPDIVDYNNPPNGQPGLWCQWVPSLDLKGIGWDGNEKFYSYTEWLEYIVNHFLKPWGYVLNGSVGWRGEDFSDTGVLHVYDNVVVSSREPDLVQLSKVGVAAQKRE